MGVDDGDEDRECGRCHETMHIPPGAEPSEFCHDCAHSLVDELRAERDQFKAMWERDSTALGKALAQRDTARTDAEDKRARVSELEAAGRAVLNCNDQVCAFGHGGCPAQCRADEMLRKAIRCAGNKEGSRE